jgi:hypothetical protein
VTQSANQASPLSAPSLPQRRAPHRSRGAFGARVLVTVQQSHSLRLASGTKREAERRKAHGVVAAFGATSGEPPVFALVAEARLFWEARSPSGALPRFSPKVSRPFAQSGPALHGRGQLIRAPGSQLLADRPIPENQVGRPGEFPNRPHAVCETAPGTALAPLFRSHPESALGRARWVLLARHAARDQQIPPAEAISLVRRQSFFALCSMCRRGNCDALP